MDESRLLFADLMVGKLLGHDPANVDDDDQGRTTTIRVWMDGLVSSI